MAVGNPVPTNSTNTIKPIFLNNYLYNWLYVFRGDLYGYMQEVW